MVVGLFWLIGLFLPQQDYRSLNWVSGLTAERIFTKLADSITLQKVFIQKSDTLSQRNWASRSNQFLLTSVDQFQHLAFNLTSTNQGIVLLEGEIQISPDEAGNRIELRCRINLYNTPMNKWKYWLTQWRINAWLESVKKRIIYLLPE